MHAASSAPLSRNKVVSSVKSAFGGYPTKGGLPDAFKLPPRQPNEAAGGTSPQQPSGQPTAPAVPPVDLEIMEQAIAAAEQQQAASAEIPEPAPAQAPDPVPTPPPPIADQPQLSPQELLQRRQQARTDQVIEESMQTVAPAAPQAIAEATDSLNPQVAGATGAKERLDGSAGAPDASQADTEQAIGDVTHVEQERTPELSPEVEAYLTKIQDHANQLPQEIAIADDGQEIQAKPYVAQPVIVLPIDEETEKAGLKKNTTFSIRWLVEWSRKIMKMFSGKVVYRQDDPTDNP